MNAIPHFDGTPVSLISILAQAAAADAPPTAFSWVSQLGPYGLLVLALFLLATGKVVLKREIDNEKARRESDAAAAAKILEQRTLEASRLLEKTEKERDDWKAQALNLYRLASRSQEIAKQAAGPDLERR